ncbi:MAG: hypothetical protein HYX88_01400 [Chloroflexi bacterium]|nr:hypothetical protein [Chloroflexota bacterium]
MHRDPARWKNLHKGHVTLAEAGPMARLAGVKKLVLNHWPRCATLRQLRRNAVRILTEN